ncbi:O-antigen ligase family protein [Vibrio sp. SCSIO 43135]|nr:O-antigen ligase family protein [Vibrio sp. SCSIO 43135]
MLLQQFRVQPSPQSSPLPSTHFTYEQFIAFVVIFSLIIASLVSQVAALIFLLSGLFHVIKRFDYVFAAFKQCWPLFAFSLVGILSTLWSDDPATSLKRGIQIFLTTLICVSLLYTVRKEIILSVLTISLTIITLYALSSSNTVTIAYTGEVIRIGHFGSKNAMSSFAAFGAMVGMSTWLLPRMNPIIKLVGLACMLLSMVTFYYAKSLGTNLSFFLIVTIAAGLYFYSNKNLSVINRQVVNALALIYLLVFIATIIVLFDYGYYENLMYSLGKDPSITGRTLIWEVGFRNIAEHPILGVGLRAFWHEDNAGALEIWQLLHKEVGAPFGFHNLYIHYYVELGLLGFLAILSVLGSCLFQVYRKSTNGMETIDIFLFSLLLFFVAKSFFEVGGFAQFNISHFNICLIWIYLHNKTYFDCGKKLKVKLEGKA